jgi:hypothetical protein
MAKDPTAVFTGAISNSSKAIYNGDSIVSGATAQINIPGLNFTNFDFILTSGRGCDPQNVQNNRYVVSSHDPSTQTITIHGDWWKSRPEPGDTFELFTQVLSMQNATFYEEYPAVKTLEVLAYGNVLIESTSEARFNYYSPMQAKNMNSPNDRGSYMINFALNPYQLQPSGHLNFSNSQETYLKYTSDWISATNRAELIVRATAINFLHIDKCEGSVNILYP